MSAGDGKISLPQYRALRYGRGFVELDGWSSVTVAGADRQAFLNNFCTNDVKRLVAGESCEAFFTNVKGKILGHGLVSCRDGETVFITVPGQAATLIEHLDRYIIREDVQLRDTTNERGYLLIAGGKGADDPIPKIGKESPTRWVRWNIFARPVCGLMETPPGSLDELRKILIDWGDMPCDYAVFDTLRIEVGMSLFGVDFDGHNFPQEVDRNDCAISFTKGCYLGQETVARIDALGHVNQQIVGVRFDGANVPEFGAELTHAGAVAGRVTSATFSPQLQAPLALAMVRREWHKPGSRLDSPLGTCEAISLPV
jgi:tRNA-modifying protein YgfZ